MSFAGDQRKILRKLPKCIRPSCRDQSSIGSCGWTIYREVCGDEHGLLWETLSLVWLGSPTLWSACLNACKHPHLSIVLHAMLICWHVTRRIGVTCPNYNIFTISHLSNVARRLSTSISPHLQIIVLVGKIKHLRWANSFVYIFYLSVCRLGSKIHQERSRDIILDVLIRYQFGQVRKRKDKRRRGRLQGAR